MREFYDVYWQDFRIWGVTAAILRNLSYQIGWHSGLALGRPRA